MQCTCSIDQKFATIFLPGPQVCCMYQNGSFGGMIVHVLPPPTAQGPLRRSFQHICNPITIQIWYDTTCGKHLCGLQLHEGMPRPLEASSLACCMGHLCRLHLALYHRLCPVPHCALDLSVRWVPNPRFIVFCSGQLLPARYISLESTFQVSPFLGFCIM